MYNVYEEDRNGKQTLLFTSEDEQTAFDWFAWHKSDNPSKGMFLTGNRLFKVGDVVRYSDGWCSEGEKELLLVVLEDRTNDSERYLVGTINHSNVFGHTETVFADMIVSAQ